MKFRNILTALFLAAPLALNAAHHDHMDKGHDHDHDMVKKADTKITKAIAVIYPTQGNSTLGTVTFTQTEGGIRVEGRIENLSPGKHGFHVHEYGDLSKIDGTSTGGHFNPKGKPHGGPDDMKRHIGDLGNIEANEDGVAEFSFVDKKLSFKGTSSIIGRGLIVHAGEDDLTSQPTGAAGARVGMAVIGVANTE